MSWVQLKLNATAETAEKIGDLLITNGAQSVTFTDSYDTPVFEPLPGETLLWGDTDVMGLFTADFNITPVIDLLNRKKGLIPLLRYKLEQLEDKDWIREWMDQFHPMQFGQRLWICPSWREVPDEGAVNVMLDPGLAFGTGTHATTRLCLEWLDSLDLKDKTVVDFGCGSGILAVAALKLGAKRVIGIDIDPQAIQASRANAQRNGVEQQLELYLPQEQPRDFEADVVVANILAGPLQSLSGTILAYVKPSGVFALSGILENQSEEVTKAYQASSQMAEPVILDEWVRLTGKKYQ